MTELSAKAYVDGLLFRPSREKAREYYARSDVPDEILQAMKIWHVRYEPGTSTKHRWLVMSDAVKLRDTLLAAIDRMKDECAQFPYLRLDGRRFSPVTSWEAGDMWGRDLIVEMDGPGWRYCFDAMRPVLTILNRLGVHFWLKYTGHHSLHVVVPAECFPFRDCSVPLAEMFTNLAWRILAVFDVVCCRPVSDAGFGGGSMGTNMPYTLNEHSGLLNYPVLEDEIPDFKPGDAHVRKALVRHFWRDVPPQKLNSATKLLQVAVSDLSRRDLPEAFNVAEKPPFAYDDLLRHLASCDAKKRSLAVARAPWFRSPEAGELVIRSLRDRHRDVRKAAVKALVGIDHPDEQGALKDCVDAGDAQLASWARRVLQVKRDVAVVRRGIHNEIVG